MYKKEEKNQYKNEAPILSYAKLLDLGAGGLIANVLCNLSGNKLYHSLHFRIKFTFFSMDMINIIAIYSITQYLQQVDSLLELISTCRSGDFEAYLAALENNIKYFFAHDLLNYARLMPVHLAQLRALEHEDPSTWQAFKEGEFVCSKSEVPFTRLYTDQALEQENKVLKGQGGMVGLCQDEKALDRLLVITPTISRIGIHQHIPILTKYKQTSRTLPAVWHGGCQMQ